MASRNRKSTTLPSTAVISYFRELPGAVFFGVPRRYVHVTDRTGATHEVDATSITSIDPESLLYAARLQRVRREYENDDCQEMLWHDLSQMGFDSREIRQFVANPAAITNCGYGMPNGLWLWHSAC
ncbi:MAG: hypothetical protein JWP25_7026 [Bradyrhizobium sp.]|nr:hypothetical protein [Bradyrhizobium sp.]